MTQKSSKDWVLRGLPEPQTPELSGQRRKEDPSSLAAMCTMCLSICLFPSILINYRGEEEDLSLLITRQGGVLESGWRELLDEMTFRMGSWNGH